MRAQAGYSPSPGQQQGRPGHSLTTDPLLILFSLVESLPADPEQPAQAADAHRYAFIALALQDWLMLDLKVLFLRSGHWRQNEQGRAAN